MRSNKGNSLIEIKGKVTATFGNAVESKSAGASDRALRKLAKIIGALPGMNATCIFFEDNILDPMQPIFNGPVPTPALKDLG